MILLLILLQLNLDSLRHDYGNNQHIWQGDTNYVQFDTLTGWISRPNQRVNFCDKQFDTWVTTDYQGFRYNPSNKRNKIVLVGDSFTFGWGVNDSETAAYHLSAYNVSCPGWNTFQQLSALKRWTKDRDTTGMVFVLIWNQTDESENHYLAKTPTLKDKSQFDQFIEVLNKHGKLDWWTRMMLVYTHWSPPGFRGDPVKDFRRDFRGIVFILPVLPEVEFNHGMNGFIKGDYYSLDGHLTASGQKKLADKIRGIVNGRTHL